MMQSPFILFPLVYLIGVAVSVPQMWLMYRLSRRHELVFPGLLIGSAAAGCALLCVTWFTAARWLTMTGLFLIAPLLTSAVTVLLAMFVASIAVMVLGASRAVTKHLR